MQYMNLAEAAERLRVKAQWLKRSDAPRLRLSRGVVRFRVDALDAWAAERGGLAVEDGAAHGEGGG